MACLCSTRLPPQEVVSQEVIPYKVILEEVIIDGNPRSIGCYTVSTT
jgi:hypothetical protein